MVVVQTGCDARRDECRVAGHTNEEQRGSAPVCAAKMGYLFMEITLFQATNSGRMRPDYTKEIVSPDSVTPENAVVHVWPGAIGYASVQVPVAMISPAVSAWNCGCVFNT